MKHIKLPFIVAVLVISSESSAVTNAKKPSNAQYLLVRDALTKRIQKMSRDLSNQRINNKENSVKPIILEETTPEVPIAKNLPIDAPQPIQNVELLTQELVTQLQTASYEELLSQDMLLRLLFYYGKVSFQKKMDLWESTVLAKSPSNQSEQTTKQTIRKAFIDLMATERYKSKESGIITKRLKLYIRGLR
jgi:hypothetical protein